MVTGLDLVRMQIEIAQGTPLHPSAQNTRAGDPVLAAEAPRQSGHAIEARLYAEDPAHDFLPSTGTLHVWRPTAGVAGLRIDSGVEEGTEIGVYYDPLLAKVIAHAPDRESAVRNLTYALKHFAAQGVETNREFLIRVLEHEEFRAGRAHTGFHLEPITVANEKLEQMFAEIVAAYIERIEHTQRKILPSIPPRFRNNPYPAPASKFEIAGHEYKAGAPGGRAEIQAIKNESVEALVDGVRHHFYVRQAGDKYFVRSALGQRTVVRLPRYPRAAKSGHRQAASSPMPGQVLRVVAGPGQQVAPGDPLLVLEAMKMEQTIRATMAGIVQAVLVKPGEMVMPGQMLVEIRSVEESDEHTSSSAASD
jgi:propionyl-CoA carboxylase alpha chain